MRTPLSIVIAGLLLALASVDSSHAQSSTNEIWLRGNELPTRQRLERETREQRDEGRIRRWSPDALVFPLKPLSPAATASGAVAPPPSVVPDMTQPSARPQP
jgi:hypothetical protein